MRIERLALKGFSSAFPGVVELNLRDVPPGLIGIVGRNGRGKTTLLEAVAGALYRQLPSRNNEDPVTYATGRDSFIDLEFSIAETGFRARLNLDGPKRQTDALLEAIQPDGARAPLNDGKRSTFDDAIRQRFPSFDLFINSSFAAQGRGDEFTRRKPSQRKDLFVEFLALQHYATMAATAAEAAALVADARLRLEVQAEGLERDTAPALVDALDTTAHRLQLEGGTAEVRQLELRDSIQELEARAAAAGDQMTAYTTAQQRVATLQAELAGRQGERDGVTSQIATARRALADEQNRITARRDAELTDIDTRVANNESIRRQAEDIRAAVARIAELDTDLATWRRSLEICQAAHTKASEDLRAAEREVSALAPVEVQLHRSKSDAALLGTVPCGGAGTFAGCQFLVNATDASRRVDDLARRVADKPALAATVADVATKLTDHAAGVAEAKRWIAEHEADRARLQKLASYEPALAAADARLAELTEKRASSLRSADEELGAAQARCDARLTELDGALSVLDRQSKRLMTDLEVASADLAAAAAGNTQAVVLKADLYRARLEWDAVTAALATVANGRQELERRRLELQAKHARLVDVRLRLAVVDQELVEWRDLAKALGKGGLPDLEIDAAGPTITATTNELLLACFGPRFSLELVTQVAKAGGAGMKDLFTVVVTDNEAGGDPRDISQLSGGEKTVVQEALMSAIALYVNQRSPMPIRTLWRDETGAALDPENAIRYVQMLRKVRELGGFVHVFFISHNAEAAALADAQIRVGDGQAVLVHPPFTEAA